MSRFTSSNVMAGADLQLCLDPLNDLSAFRLPSPVTDPAGGFTEGDGSIYQFPAGVTEARTAECNAANWGWRVAGIRYTATVSVTPKFNGDCPGYLSFGITPGAAVDCTAEVVLGAETTPSEAPDFTEGSTYIDGHPDEFLTDRQPFGTYTGGDPLIPDQYSGTVYIAFSIFCRLARYVRLPPVGTTLYGYWMCPVEFRVEPHYYDGPTGDEIELPYSQVADLGALGSMVPAQRGTSLWDRFTGVHETIGSVTLTDPADLYAQGQECNLERIPIYSESSDDYGRTNIPNSSPVVFAMEAEVTCYYPPRADL